MNSGIHPPYVEFYKESIRFHCDESVTSIIALTSFFQKIKIRGQTLFQNPLYLFDKIQKWSSTTRNF